MGYRHYLLIGCLALPFVALTQAVAQKQEPPQKQKEPVKVADAAKLDYAKDVRPVLDAYCTRCHGVTKPKAGLNLEKFKDEAAVLKNPLFWEKVAHQIRSGEMPPAGAKKIPLDKQERLLTWIDTQASGLDCTKKRDPGRVTLRRLNRNEYNNTIRDLVGVKFRPADDFPSDDVGYGFDNIGDVLTMSPLLFEKYLAAADRILDEAFKTPELRKRILVAQPGKDWENAARSVIYNFVKRAYRRPVTPDEMTRLVRFVDLAQKNGDGFDKGIQLALKAALVSPHFLFRVERDQKLKGEETAHLVGQYELASRLSYFLWSTMPDDELFTLAAKGELRKHLDAQVRRMLRDPKAQAMAENFAGQWLNLRMLQTAAVDPGTFPKFNEKLRKAMIRETELFFDAIVKEDRSVLDFLDADFSFVNEQLAQHYGLPAVKGEAFQRVSLRGTERYGVLTHASVLTLTSNPNRTSPVKRGKWILENILNAPPPPPPPDVPELAEEKGVELKGSLRQRMELHRTKPDCAVCHQRMDPLGFGFENFDGVGGWRTHDGKFKIDASGELPNGQKFQGPKELVKILKGREAEFRRCLAEKLLTYALGRGLEYYDKCAVDDICAAVVRNDNRFSSLVLAIVQSEPFQYRRGKR
jgi:hypothetical protein